jgi:GntR family transcriptional regulator, arabinose operon transcriptional repressor
MDFKMNQKSSSSRLTPEGAGRRPVHRFIYEMLLSDIETGKYATGSRLPSEAELCERFEASRITVAKALQTLQQSGLIVRRAGSGTFVGAPKEPLHHQFGLLIPDLGQTEIFEPICKGMMRSTTGESNSLLWGQTSASEGTRSEDAERLCRQFVKQKVAGVFFAPIEYIDGQDLINFRLVSTLRDAKIPVVLIDRSYEEYPKQSELDLVGIDNYRAGWVLAQHLWNQGARRIIFAARSRSASTVVERIAGYEAVLRACKSKYQGHVYLGDVEDERAIKQLLGRERPDGIVCGNDLTAAKLMKTLIGAGVAVPDEIRMVGIDDVQYARYLPVPLTTIHQDCNGIGSVAMQLMLDRLRNPRRQAIEARVPFRLIVRKSCGANESDQTPISLDEQADVS